MNDETTTPTETVVNGQIPPPPAIEPVAKKSAAALYISFGAIAAAVGVIIFIATYAKLHPNQSVTIDIPSDIEVNVPSQTESVSDEEWGFPPKVDPLQGTMGDEKHLSNPLTEDTFDYSGYYKNLVQQAGVVWLNTPEPQGDLRLFTATGSVISNNFKDYTFEYWKLAEVDGQPLLFVQLPCFDMFCNQPSLFFIGTPETGFRLLTQQSDIDTQENHGYEVSYPASVRYDDTFVLDAYQLGETLVVNGVEFSLFHGAGWFGGGKSFFANSLMNTTQTHRNVEYIREFVADTKYGPVFRGKRILWDGLTADLDYAIRLPGGLYVTLWHTPDFMYDDRVPRIGWLDGTNNEDPYRSDGLSGCGIGGPEIMFKPIETDDLLLAGYTINQEPVYKVMDPYHPIVNRMFELGDATADERPYYEYNEVTEETEQFTITRHDFIEAGGVLIYIDEFGLQNVLTNTKYGPQAECAKPVVYLYPESPTEVSVQLDAIVTKSDPPYGTGWTTRAYPDGTLIVDGETYDSLFWDGYGTGQYPVLEQGFVVPTPDALPLMTEHLRTMGFTEKEVADFIEFWAPHMPDAPYTRFSWIGTTGMETLAKLTIEPKPDTMIRAFVDFEGLDNPLPIEPQRIPQYERTGFVATEWGGLLRQ